MCVLVATASLAYAGDSHKKEIGRTTEREINVVLSTSFGKVIVARGAAEKIVTAEGYSKKKSSLPIELNYEIRNRIGYLDLSLGDFEQNDGKRGSFDFSNLEGGTWNLRFSNAIPVSFDVELGVAKADFDMTGLEVKDFKLSAGASDVVLSFNSRNASTIDEMTIESGVGKFEGRNLGNANFKAFRYDGGVGAATLDFSGKIQSEVDVDIRVGMGVCTIIIPKDVGARVFFTETLVSRIDCDRSIRSAGENQYLTENYRSASARMNIRIDAGLGKVNIRQE